MRLFEMEKLPTRAGVAELEFPTGATVPQRRGDTITIPRSDSVEFFSLMAGDQFLVRMSDRGSRQAEIFFGGTDEQPFLVMLQQQAFMTFAQCGEAGFYKALRPPEIKKLEATYRSPETGERRTKRQGDIFAHALQWPWRGLVLQALEKLDSEVYLQHREVKLFGTRHTLRGVFGSFWIPEIREKMLVGEGRLEAADHAPLDLKGPHAFVQTALLFDPKNAE